MFVNEKVLKSLSEVKYLTAENVERYRMIIRYLYREHEKIHYWVHKEDVYEMMVNSGLFVDYTLEKCQSDLLQLVEWKNLIAIQDSKNITTIEEFKNRKFRYQLSDYTVEIERMTLKLENLELEGTSLETTLLERIHHNILKLSEMVNQTNDVVSSWWNDLNTDFIRLNRNYQDYIKTLNSAKAEEMMKTEEFLIFKDSIIQYLRSFVKGLQEQALVLEEYVNEVNIEDLKILFNKIAQYEMTIPRIDYVVSESDVYEKCMGRWKSIYNWFVGEENESEVNRISDITVEIIRKITRYAQQIGEMHNISANRKEEYRHIANIFSKCNDLNEAHCLSAMIFGVETSLHLKDLNPRETESIDSSVYEETPTFIALDSYARKNTIKNERVPAIDYALEKQIQKLQQLEKMSEDEKLIRSYINNNCINFEKLPQITSYTRKILLTWLSRGLSNKHHRARTEWGDYYMIDTSNKKICIIQCDDGQFTMPAFKIIFESEEN